MQAWRNVISKPLLANADVRACRTLSLDDSDLAIQIMSSLNLRKRSASRRTKWDRVVVTGYTSVFRMYNWSPCWVTTLFRQILFNSTMISRALVMNLECFSNTNSKALLYRVSAQVWVKCFYIWHHNVKHCFLLSSFSSLVRRSFQLSRSPIYCRLSWQNSYGQFLQKSALVGLNINFRKAVMREMLMFPAYCSKCTGMSLISTFNKFSGVILCVVKSGYA